MRIALGTLLVVLALLTPLVMPSIAGATHPCVQVEGSPDAPDPCPDADHGMPGPGVDPVDDPQPAPDETVVEGTVEDGVVAPDGGTTVEVTPDPGVDPTPPPPSTEFESEDALARAATAPEPTPLAAFLAYLIAWLDDW